jgi:putative lipoic acid-binding regulatory protein
MKRPKIDYPCEWEYRIITRSEEELRKLVAEILKAKQYALSFSNISKAGKYISFALKTNVITEEERNQIYVSLRSHSSVKSVI